MPTQNLELLHESGRWQLHVGRRELRVHGVVVPIGSRAFEIIEILARSEGELVTKDELMQRVWPGAIVGENTLHVHVSAVRRALGADRTLLKTISGRGYRLVGNWTSRSAEPAPAGPRRDDQVTQVLEQRAGVGLPGGSTLIGRASAARHLHDLLSAYRVVTLTGPGGIGKTSLAIDVARAHLDTFEGDVHFVELATVGDPRHVASTVAAAIGLLSMHQEASAEWIAQAIGRRRLLLLIDNCEHVIDAAAAIVEAVVKTCPRTSILTTSRESLRIDGEHTYRVPPLDVPPSYPPASGDLRAHSAIQLFLARNRALRSDFAPGEADLPAIAAICRRLDGIPLAIELAAARAATLGLEEVVARLDQRFKLLTSGRRTALPRHQTLRATLDWSYDLLSDAERDLLCRLSVFVAGFTIDAATAVVMRPDGDAPEVTEGIGSLVTKSLVFLDGTVTQARWRLLETTRAYALEKLTDRGEGPDTMRRQAQFFLDLFTRAPAAAGRRQPSDQLARWSREIDNIRAVLDWAFSSEGDSDLGVALTTAYVPVWLHLSLMAECRQRVERALEGLAPDENHDPHVRLQLQAALGVALMNTTALLETTRVALERAASAARDLGDIEIQLHTLWALWTFHSNNGEIKAAHDVAATFSRIAAQSRDPSSEIVGDRLIGNTLHYRGDQRSARRHLERVVDLYVAPRDGTAQIWFHFDQRVLAQGVLARVLCLQGSLERAVEAARRSLADAEATDHKLSLCFALGQGLCPVALMTGDLETAQHAVTRLIEVATINGIDFWVSLARCLEAKVVIRSGDPVRGTTMLRAALDVFRRTGRVVHYVEFLGALAEGLAGCGEMAEAMATVEEAIARSNRDGERWCLPDLLRLKGWLRQAADDTIGGAAEQCFQEAIEEAREQDALLWELRATLNLAQLKVRQRQRGEARSLLASVHARFSEGLHTPDLAAARALLASVGT